MAHDVVVCPERYGSYQVDHRDWNNLDCRLRNLELLPAGRHLSYERWGWKKKVLKLSVKKAMVKRVQDDPVALRLR